MAKARNWAGLSDGQRKRYISAGRTGTLTGRKGLTPAQVKAYYEKGGNLSSARGHKEEITAPRKTALKAATGNVTKQEKQTLKTWRKSRNYPTWLPRSNEVMRDDVAAALSLLGTAPRNWKTLVVRENTDGSGTYSVVVVTKRGARRSTELPDREAVKEFASLLKNTDKQGRTKTEKKDLKSQWYNANGQIYEFDVSFIYLSELGPSGNETDVVKLPTAGRALPKRKSK